MKYIFTDFDGVLNNTSDTPGSFLTHSPDTYGASERNLRLMRELAERTGAHVVISSNWRKFDPDGVWIHPRGHFKNPVYGILDTFGDAYAGMLPVARHKVKSEALDMWFAENGLDPACVKYVVFDDDPDELFQESRHAGKFIMTDPESGLTARDVERAVSILS